MKKLLSVAMTLCIIVNICTIACSEEMKNAPQNMYEQKFSDVATTHWAFSYIAEMSNRGVLSGYPDGKFYPNSQVTRAEFAKIMTSAAGLILANPTEQIFEDVKTTDWHAPYVHTAKDFLGSYILSGKSYYYPNSPALREDIAVALVKLKGYSTAGNDTSAVAKMFKDSSSISENAKVYVATAVDNGLISGYEDGTFRGQNSITRAEAATLLWRAYQQGNANKNFDETPPTDRKPFTMKVLSDANVENSELAAIDDENNIFYIDSSDNCVYKLNTKNGSKSKFFNPDALSYTLVEENESEANEEIENIETEYSSFVPYQVFL